MKYIDLSHHVDEFVERLSDDHQDPFFSLWDNILFKLNRNVYHYNRIHHYVHSVEFHLPDDLYHDITLPIYYEMESLLVSLRSSVDMLLSLVNFSLSLDVQGDLTIGSIYHHPRLPKVVKNVFQRYTRPHSNPTWEFILTVRNEVVHERGVHQMLPLTLDYFQQPPTLFMEYNAENVDTLRVLKDSIRFLENFHNDMCSAIRISM